MYRRFQGVARLVKHSAHLCQLAVGLSDGRGLDLEAVLEALDVLPAGGDCGGCLHLSCGISRAHTHQEDEASREYKGPIQTYKDAVWAVRRQFLINLGHRDGDAEGVDGQEGTQKGAAKQTFS